MPARRGDFIGKAAVFGSQRGKLGLETNELLRQVIPGRADGQHGVAPLLEELVHRGQQPLGLNRLSHFRGGQQAPLFQRRSHRRQFDGRPTKQLFDLAE